MDMDAALLARLLADATVAGIVGDRASWVERPQAEALPAITLQIVSDARDQHLKGFNDLQETRVQVDCWAATHKEARALDRAVVAALAPERTGNGIIFNRAIFEPATDGGEKAGTIFIHRSRRDLLVWWQVQPET